MERPSLSEPEAAALRAYVHALQERRGPQLLDVMLFGSAARGDAHPGSDIDVLVILDHPDAEALSDARGLAFDIWLAHHVLLSIRAMSQQSWQALAARRSLFYRNLMRDGISVLPVRV
jgi:predicted nucleotidyltransferase